MIFKIRFRGDMLKMLWDILKLQLVASESWGGMCANIIGAIRNDLDNEKASKTKRSYFSARSWEMRHKEDGEREKERVLVS